jgi:hypothetical protein
MPVPKSELMRRLRERRRAERLAAAPTRACKVCGSPLPATARADARCCSAGCRAQLSRTALAAIALTPAEVAELYGALGALLAALPIGGKKSLAQDGVRFAVTKWGGDFMVEGKGGWSRLKTRVSSCGADRRYQQTARFDRALYEAMCPHH